MCLKKNLTFLLDRMSVRYQEIAEDIANQVCTTVFDSQFSSPESAQKFSQQHGIECSNHPGRPVVFFFKDKIYCEECSSKLKKVVNEHLKSTFVSAMDVPVAPVSEEMQLMERLCAVIPSLEHRTYVPYRVQAREYAEQALQYAKQHFPQYVSQMEDVVKKFKPLPKIDQ